MGNDGRIALRRQLAQAWQAAGLSQQQAERRATSQALGMNMKSPGVHDVHAGNTVVRVVVREKS